MIFFLNFVVAIFEVPLIISRAQWAINSTCNLRWSLSGQEPGEASSTQQFVEIPGNPDSYSRPSQVLGKHHWETISVTGDLYIRATRGRNRKYSSDKYYRPMKDFANPLSYRQPDWYCRLKTLANLIFRKISNVRPIDAITFHFLHFFFFFFFLSRL